MFLREKNFKSTHVPLYAAVICNHLEIFSVNHLSRLREYSLWRTVWLHECGVADRTCRYRRNYPSKHNHACTVHSVYADPNCMPHHLGFNYFKEEKIPSCSRNSQPQSLCDGSLLLHLSSSWFDLSRDTLWLLQQHWPQYSLSSCYSSSIFCHNQSHYQPPHEIFASAMEYGDTGTG